jgi:hypothetical protein
MASHALCRRCLGGVVRVEDTVLRHKGLELLLVVRDSRWQRTMWSWWLRLATVSAAAEIKKSNAISARSGRAGRGWSPSGPEAGPVLGGRAASQLLEGGVEGR